VLTLTSHLHHVSAHPVHLEVAPAAELRDRLSTFFRPLLAIPHLILVGAPVALTISWAWGAQPGREGDSGIGAGILGLAACFVTLASWVSILATRHHPESLRTFSTWFLRWRIRANAYAALLRDEYPPFGEDEYPVSLRFDRVEVARDRFSVALRPLLAIPHVLMMWVLGVAWFFATIGAWIAIVFTGRHPAELYRFGVGVLRFNATVEAYLLLLHDELPPFSLEGGDGG